MTNPAHNRGWTLFASQLVFLAVSVFALAATASAEWKEKVLHNFQGGHDGAMPIGGPVLDKHSNLYGATLNGGSESCAAPSCGTIFQVSPPHAKDKNWTEKILHAFKGNAFGDGSGPGGGVIFDRAGNLYGVTVYGGTGDCVLLGTKVGCGAMYELSPPASKGSAWTETVLYSFPTSADGEGPIGSLVMDADGNLYGATQSGGSSTQCGNFIELGCGVIFELSPPHRKGGAWSEKVLHRFDGNLDGGGPTGNLVLDGKGNLYGATFYGGGLGNCGGGVPYCGTVFELVRPGDKGSAWSEVMIHRFTGGSDGGAPAPTSGLIRDALGRLYGTAELYEKSIGGTAFRFAPRDGGWIEDILPCCGSRLFSPWSSFIFDNAGNLYGTATRSETKNCCGPGGVSRISHSKKGYFATTLYIFPKSKRWGGAPESAVALDHAGNVYGVATIGGTGTNCPWYGCGVVFKLTPR